MCFGIGVHQNFVGDVINDTFRTNQSYTRHFFIYWQVYIWYVRWIYT